VSGGPYRTPTGKSSEIYLDAVDFKSPSPVIVITADHEPQRIYRMSDRRTHQPIAKNFEAKISSDEYTSEYWHAEAKKIVEEQLKKAPNTKKAKNIIFFLGDGMSHVSVGKCIDLLKS
jgi:alkaline phosphatase